MFVNPNKLKAVIIDKKEQITQIKRYKLSNKDIQIVPSVKLLVITIDDRLNFNEHISSICESTANQLKVLVRVKHFLALTRC